MRVNERPPLASLRLVVLISGRGTTLRNFIEKIASGQLDAQILLVISSSSSAGGLDISRQADIPTAIVERKDFESTEHFSRAIFDRCRRENPHLIAMAGFLKLLVIPGDFQNRVMNIHPALVPAFCGSGYYGRRVHQAVLDYGSKVTGCTVHFVDAQYDHGPIVLQKVVPVLDGDTPEVLAARVFEQECKAYPEALRLFAQGRLRIEGRRARITGP